jgi:hypothetical protein
VSIHPATRVLYGLAAAAAFSGCVERKILIQSDPPGALVRMDGRPLGKTPVEVDFTWYGTHEVIVDLPGHPVIDAYPTITSPAYRLGAPRPPPDQAAVDELLRRATLFRGQARSETR